jgi:hypothetical protein
VGDDWLKKAEERMDYHMREKYGELLMIQFEAGIFLVCWRYQDPELW